MRTDEEISQAVERLKQNRNKTSKDNRPKVDVSIYVLLNKWSYEDIEERYGSTMSEEDLEDYEGDNDVSEAYENYQTALDTRGWLDGDGDIEDICYPETQDELKS